MLQSALGYIRWSVLLAATVNTAYCLIIQDNGRRRLESDGVTQVDSGIVHMFSTATQVKMLLVFVTAEEQRTRPEDTLTLDRH